MERSLRAVAAALEAPVFFFLAVACADFADRGAGDDGGADRASSAAATAAGEADRAEGFEAGVEAGFVAQPMSARLKTAEAKPSARPRRRGKVDPCR